MFNSEFDGITEPTFRGIVAGCRAHAIPYDASVFDSDWKDWSGDVPGLRFYLCKIQGRLGSSVSLDGKLLHEYPNSDASRRSGAEGLAATGDIYGSVTWVEVWAGAGKTIAVNTGLM